MKFILTILVVMNGLVANAQTKSREQYTVWQQLKENTAMIYASKANVRTDASISSTIKDSLAVGDTVFIKSFTENFYTQNGIYAPWADISYNRDGKQVDGFIWLGSVAIGFATRDDQSTLFGIESAKSATVDKEYGPQNFFQIKIKSVKNNSVIAVASLAVPDDESFSYLELKLLGDPQLKNISEVVRIMFGGEACGVSSNYHYFGLSNDKFLTLPTKYSVGDADVYYHAESLIFPNESGGKPNKIIRYIVEEELIQEATSKKKEIRKKFTETQIYNWDGKKAVLVKK